MPYSENSNIKPSAALPSAAVRDGHGALRGGWSCIQLLSMEDRGGSIITAMSREAAEGWGPGSGCSGAAGSPPGQQRGLSRTEHAADPGQPRGGSRNMGTPERTNALSHRSTGKGFCKDEATATCKPTAAMVLGQAESRKTVFLPEIQ